MGLWYRFCHENILMSQELPGALSFPTELDSHRGPYGNTGLLLVAAGCTAWPPGPCATGLHACPKPRPALTSQRRVVWL